MLQGQDQGGGKRKWKRKWKTKTRRFFMSFRGGTVDSCLAEPGASLYWHETRRGLDAFGSVASRFGWATFLMGLDSGVE